MTIKTWKNQTELHSVNNVVLYSYTTPVAAFISGRGVVVSSTKYSNTTNKHIKEFIARNAPCATLSLEDQSFFDNLISINIKP